MREQSATEFAAATARKRVAETAALQARARRATEQQRLEETLRGDSLQDGLGKVSVAALVHADAFLAEAERRVAATVSAERAAAEQVRGAEQEELRAAARLAAASTAEKLVSDHQERVRASDRASARAREDEDAEEGWRSRVRGKVQPR